MTALEVVRLMIEMSMFTIALINLCYKIFKDDDKK